MNLVTDEKIKNQVIFYLNNNLNCNYTGFVFPIPNINFIKRDNLKNIKNGYKFLIKSSNAKHGILFFYKNENGENKQYILFKNGDLFKTDICCEESYYNDTIIEIFYENKKIQMCDIFIYKGNKMSSLNFSSRYYTLLNFSDKCKDLECLPFYYNEIKETEEIYMIPLNIGSLNKFSTCFKWKNPKEITFLLKLKYSENSADLYTTIFKNEVLFAKIKGKILEDIKNKYMNDSIINIKLENDNIYFFSASEDNIYPTSLRYIENIMIFIQDDIKLCELFL
jgi:hypothetical protein